MTVAADGTVRGGAQVPLGSVWPECCGAGGWTVGPDGVAYGIANHFDDNAVTASTLSAVGPTGVPAGFPVAIDGAASAPSFDAAGDIVVTVGSAARGTSRVLVFESAGGEASVTSPELQIGTADSGADCVNYRPSPPIVAQNGTIFPFNQAAAFALTPQLEVMPGWPYAPATPFVYRIDDHPLIELACGSPSLPAVGPDGTLYVPLRGFDESVGGTLAAITPDGGSRAGWPVELRRPGSAFWTVVVGPDGTVYALAVEPEAGGGSSATILTIAPDSTVLARTTIIDP